MERLVIKKQNAETFFKETFHDVIEQFGSSNIFFCGRKMYIRVKFLLSLQELIWHFQILYLWQQV